MAIRSILEELLKGEISIDEAEKRLRFYQLEELGEIAKFDVGREIRKGIPEIILGEGKSPEDVVDVAEKALQEQGRVLISRINKEHVNFLRRKLEDRFRVEIHEKARVAVVRSLDFKPRKSGGRVGIVAAGTSDIPFAEEARVVAEEMGCEVITAYDVGVAGVHRIFKHLKRFFEKDVDVIIVAAGREAALPSVIAGLVDVLIIGLPTSIGYGFGGKGISSLTSMLQACPLGIATVNIDAGVAAGVVAAIVANRAARFRRT